MADLFDRLGDGELDPVYVIYSTEPLLVDRVVSAIRNAVVQPAMRAFNDDTIDGKGATAARILGAVQTLPMLATRRLVTIRDVSAVATAELALLIPYLDQPNPSTVLLAIASKLDKRIKFFATAQKKSYLHELAVPRRVGSWIRDEARARNIAMAGPAQSRLEDVVGNDLSRLSLAIDQLALYAGDRAVEVDDVDDLIADTRERTVFELTDAIGERNGERALSAVSALCDQRQSAIGVVMMLARHMRQLASVHDAIAAQTPRSELPRRLGVPPFIVDKLASQARHFPPLSCARALSKLSTADRTLKGQIQIIKTLGRALGERVILETLVSDLIALGR